MVHRKYNAHPQTVINPKSIFSNLSIPDSISHRRSSSKQKQQIEPESQLEPLSPTFPNCAPLHAKSRVAAEQLRANLTDMQSAANEAARAAPSQFDATTISFEKNLSTHQHILDDFTTEAAV
jgi:hypothetical protein